MTSVRTRVMYSLTLTVKPQSDAAVVVLALQHVASGSNRASDPPCEADLRGRHRGQPRQRSCPESGQTVNAVRSLAVIKVVHTIVWAFFAACIIAVPVLALAGQLRSAGVLSVLVLVEVTVLVLNRMRCPLTDMAQRYTDDRRAQLRYLPATLARPE